MAQLLMHKGSEAPIHDLIMAAGAHASSLHEEIWVFEGYWHKSHELWLDVQKANWDDVILHDDFKKTFRDDIESFFESEEIYREYSIPWKVCFYYHPLVRICSSSCREASLCTDLPVDISCI
jgi:transitional endoplasmic reticulum ATPase